MMMVNQISLAIWNNAAWLQKTYAKSLMAEENR